MSQARVDLRRRVVKWEGREVRVRVYPIGLDAGALEEEAGRPEVAEAERALLEWKGDSRLLLRVDRAELAKNILRGFLAFDRFLERSPEWRGRVKFLALLNPSRENIPEYGAYIEECLAAAEGVNSRWGDGDWQPARADVRDDYPSTVAAYRHYDALLVNSTLDGMNLVAKEGPILNRGNGALILSETAGAFRELGRFSIAVNAFDVEQTAQAIGEALDMPAAERRRRANGLRAAVRRNPPERWVNAQLDDLRAGRPPD
jgi:trehalose 6-phosphate synthase